MVLPNIPRSYDFISNLPPLHLLKYLKLCKRQLISAFSPMYEQDAGITSAFGVPIYYLRAPYQFGSL